MRVNKLTPYEWEQRRKKQEEYNEMKRKKKEAERRSKPRKQSKSTYRPYGPLKRRSPTADDLLEKWSDE